MTEPTDKQFATAYAQAMDQPFPGDFAKAGRAMHAALIAHGCIAQPQGLTVRQEVTLQIMIAQIHAGQIAATAADELATLILGEPK